MKIGIISGAAYAIPLLQLLTNNNIQASVFTDACSVDKDGLAVIRYFCGLASIPLHEKEHSQLYEWIKDFKPDVIFILGYSHLIDISQLPPALLYSVYNIHFGALPAFRGPNPVFWQIKTNAANLTVTIHRINNQFDKGPVVWAKDIPRAHHINYGTAHTMLSHTALEGVVYILQHYAQRKMPAIIQMDTTISRYFRRPGINEVSINWKEMEITEIINLIQACNPWNKGAITIYQGNEVKILDAEPSRDKPNSSMVMTPGIIVNNDKCLQVMCKGNKLLNIYMLLLDGSFIAARHAEKYGFVKGQQLGM